jgi:hypothetical protein
MMKKSVAFFTNRAQPFVRGLVFAGVVCALSACETSSDRASSLDPALERDLSLATAPSTNTLSTFGDTAATERTPTPVVSPVAPPSRAPSPSPSPAPTPIPRATAPRPAPTPDVVEAAPAPAATPEPAPAAAPARRSLLGAGTALVGATGTRVCNTTNRPGDRVVMRLASDVAGTDGTRLAAGTPVLLELATATDSTLTFRVLSISIEGELLPVTATAAIESELSNARVSGGNDKAKIIGGAIAGAIAGRILGGDTKGAVIGAAGGAAAGTVAAKRGGTTERCLAAGGTVRVVLTEPLLTNGTGV